MKAPESPETLDDGAWVLRGLVKVWQPTPEPPAPPAPKWVSVHDLIACPRCMARVDEPCRNRSARAAAHPERLAPRLCSCGELVKHNARQCAPCRSRSDLEHPGDTRRTAA